MTVPADIRDGAPFPMTFGLRGDDLDFEKQFFCFKELIDFPAEMAPLKHGPWEANAQAVLNSERNCASFLARIPGRAPKEHDEMQLLAQVEARTEAWQRRMEEATERRHQEMRDEGRRIARAGAFWSIAGAIIVAFVTAALAASLGTFNRDKPLSLDKSPVAIPAPSQP